MKVDLYSQTGKKVGGVNLNETIFGVKPNKSLLAQYVRTYLANQRQGTAKTKTRGEVSGGGRKPWRQKGTGRARHGSIRSPIWVGGGVAHGPQVKSWRLDMPKKMRRAALFSALSLKLKEGGIVILDKLKLHELKTKAMVEVLKKLPVRGKVLIGLPDIDKSIILSARNIKDVKTIQMSSLNAYAVLNHKAIILPQRSLVVLEETFLKEKRVAKETKKEPLKEVKSDDINTLGLSKRTLNTLERAGVKTIGELKGKTDEDLKRIKGLGEKSVAEVRNKLKVKN